MLIIPSIYISDGVCVHTVQGEPGTEVYYGMNPIKRTRLLRSENAKAIHVVDLDGAIEGRRKNAEVINRIAECVDIAIQVAGGFRTWETVNEVIRSLGVFRVVVGTISVENPNLVERLIADFTPRKIIVGIDVKNGFVHTRGRVKTEKFSAVELALIMKKIGVERIVYTNIDHKSNQLGPPFDDLKKIADETGLTITLNGTVRNYEDLKMVQELHAFRVDSLILDEALYQNVFPCQKIWRLNEKLSMEKERVARLQ